MSAVHHAARLLDLGRVPAILASVAAMVADRPDATPALLAGLGYITAAFLLGRINDSRTHGGHCGPQTPLDGDPFAAAEPADSDGFAQRVPHCEHYFPLPEEIGCDPESFPAERGNCACGAQYDYSDTEGA